MALWTWQSLRDPVVGALIDAPMKQLENYLNLAARTATAQARVATADATVTVLATIAIPVDTSVLVEGYVVARRTGGAAGATNDGAGYRVQFVAKNTAGTAALIGSATITVLGESQAGWDVTAVASSGTILVKVTGAANNNVQWRWTGRTFSVKE